MGNMKRLLGILACMSALLMSAITLAEETSASVTSAKYQAPNTYYGDRHEYSVFKGLPSEERVLGIGTSVGGGFLGAASNDGNGIGPHLSLPSLELTYLFNHTTNSVTVILPVTNMLITSNDIDGFEFISDIIFNTNLGSDKTKFIAGIGLGFNYAYWNNDSGMMLRVPMQAGVELLSPKEEFSVSILARGFAGIGAVAGYDVFGYNVTGVLVFTAYVKTTSSED